MPRTNHPIPLMASAPRKLASKRGIAIVGDVLGHFPREVARECEGTFPRLLRVRLNGMDASTTQTGRPVLLISGTMQAAGASAQVSFKGRLFGKTYYARMYARQVMAGRTFCVVVTKRVAGGVYFVEDFWPMAANTPCDPWLKYASSPADRQKFQAEVQALMGDAEIRRVLKAVPSVRGLRRWTDLLADIHGGAIGGHHPTGGLLHDALRYTVLSQQLMARDFLSRIGDGEAEAWDSDLIASAKQNLDRLPVILSEAQHRAALDIFADLEQPRQTVRLVLGDVGAGKGFLAYAVFAALIAAAQQTGIALPTMILYAPRILVAEQHYRRLTDWLQQMGVSECPCANNPTAEDYEASPMPGVVGTQRTTNIIDAMDKPPALLWVDEPQYLGVQQFVRPGHIVMSTATPLPRWVAMTMRMETSYLPQREKRVSFIPLWSWTPDADALATAMTLYEQGRGVLVLLPSRVSKRVDYPSAQEFYQTLQTHVPAEHLIYVDGEMKEKDKKAALRTWRERETRGSAYIVVATRIVEAGLDIPSLSYAVIVGPEILGAIGVYQAAGRVGRGGQVSEVWLISSQRQVMRWQYVQSMWDVMAIEEGRGAGNFLDAHQSGTLYWPYKDTLDMQETLFLSRLADELSRLWTPAEKRSFYAGVLPVLRQYLRIAPDDLMAFLEKQG